jgi:hypothetical protein
MSSLKIAEIWLKPKVIALLVKLVVNETFHLHTEKKSLQQSYAMQDKLGGGGGGGNNF